MAASEVSSQACCELDALERRQLIPEGEQSVLSARYCNLSVDLFWTGDPVRLMGSLSRLTVSNFTRGSFVMHGATATCLDRTCQTAPGS